MRHLHVRLAAAMLAMSFVVLASLVVALNWVYVRSFDERSVDSLTRLENLVTAPAWDAAVSDLDPAVAGPLREYEARIRELTEFALQIRGNRGWFLAGFYALLTPLILGLSWWLSARLTRPLDKVAAASRRLADGDLSARIRTRPSSWDRQSLDLAADFNAMAVSLERLQNERQAMIADIAHELRTPLTAMQLQLEAAGDGIEPLDHEFLARIAQEARVLSRLIVDLRTLSLAEAKHLSLEIELVELCELLQVVKASFEAEASGRRIDLRLGECRPTMVEADVERVRQVIGNFVSNAVRHTPPGGEVVLGVMPADPEQVTIEVVDTGPGLSKAALERAFDRFYRSDNGRVRAEGGSGLGLAIAKALAELHHGSVAAENRAEGGARFTFTLPTAATPARTSSDSAAR
jgi:signal transduction histidine kinase